MSGNKLSWNMVYGLQSFIGGYGSGCLGQSGTTLSALTSYDPQNLIR